MKMHSELFFLAISAIQKQMDLDHENAKKLVEVFTGATTGHLMPNKSPALEGLIFLLEELMIDRDSWIEHFIYELDFGKESARLPITMNGSIVPMNNPYDLYAFLISEKTEI